MKPAEALASLLSAMRAAGLGDAAAEVESATDKPAALLVVESVALAAEHTARRAREYRLANVLGDIADAAWRIGFAFRRERQDDHLGAAIYAECASWALAGEL